jgi:hypothetical protein
MELSTDFGYFHKNLETTSKQDGQAVRNLFAGRSVANDRARDVRIGLFKQQGNRPLNLSGYEYAVAIRGQSKSPVVRGECAPRFQSCRLQI